MDQIDKKSDIVKELCTIRRPAVWHRDELQSASPMDHSDDSDDTMEWSSQDDTGSNDGSDISVDN